MASPTRLGLSSVRVSNPAQRAALVLVALLFAGCGTSSGATAASADTPARAAGNADVRVLATGLSIPWDIAFLPDGRAVVTERAGRVRLIKRGSLRQTPVARVKTSAIGEGGLLGIAVDPAFARGKRFVYLYVTVAPRVEVQRWRLRRGRLVKDGVVLDRVRAGWVHDSGRLRFGPDGRLYVATGDAGRRQLSQRQGSLNGKILRLTRRQYRNSTAKPEIFSTGHRNPQGLTWDPISGDLFATDHGPSGFDGPQGFDEVNRVRRRSNHGWPRVFGRNHRGFAAPVRLYEEAIAPSGAAFLTRGCSPWNGDLFVAALRGEQLRRLEVTDGRVVADHALLAGRFGRLRAVVEAPDGTLWITTSNRDGRGTPTSRDDRILRLSPPPADRDARSCTAR